MFYRLTKNQGCIEGCSYIKIGGQSNEIWCIGEGNYDYQYTCKTSTIQSTLSTQTVSTESLVPETPNVTMSIKLQYEEDGVVYEQEDSYNNVTGEARIVVSAHNNNSAVEVLMLESTVSR